MSVVFLLHPLRSTSLFYNRLNTTFGHLGSLFWVLLILFIFFYLSIGDLGIILNPFLSLLHTPVYPYTLSLVLACLCMYGSPDRPGRGGGGARLCSSSARVFVCFSVLDAERAGSEFFTGSWGSEGEPGRQGLLPELEDL